MANELSTIVLIDAEMMHSASTLFENSLMSGSDGRRRHERNLYDDTLLGLTGTSPSWTQEHVGKNYAFVIQPLSSSDQEVSQLNAFISGTVSLGYGSQAPSGTMYYSKKTNFVRVLHALTASADLVFSPGTGTAASGIEQPLGRGPWNPVSGSYMNCGPDNPAILELFVPEYGKIRDIKVWIEFVHDIRGGEEPITGSSPFKHGGTGGTFNVVTGGNYSFGQGLRGVKIALRSPNVKFKYAHPLWNDSHATAQPSESPTSDTPYEVHKNSYLLWDGHSADRGTQETIPTGGVFHAVHYTYNSDIDMRTIFCDDSNVPNPAHLDQLYMTASLTSIGANESAYGRAYDDLPLWGKYPSPASASHAYFGTGVGVHYFGNQSSIVPAYGNDMPWMLDDRIDAGRLYGMNVDYSQATASDGTIVATSSFSIPDGWLTGPGGSAAANEFLTQGMQIGPETIRPVYPLLDDVYAARLEVYNGSLIPYKIPTFNMFSGFRPGLRGTEIHGMWKLLIGCDQNTYFAQQPGNRSGIWFRQWRIEFLIDQREETSTTNNETSKRFKRVSYVTAPIRPLSLLSGTVIQDSGISYAYTVVRPDHGRSLGITDDTGSAGDFAVFTRLTGTLYDSMVAAGSSALRAYLHNEFGTPYIPLSSGSGTPVSAQVFNQTEQIKSLTDRILSPRTIVGGDQTAAAVISRAGKKKLSADIAREIISGSA